MVTNLIDILISVYKRLKNLILPINKSIHHMKKILLIFGASFFLLSVNSLEEINQVQTDYSLECKYRQCNATAKSTGKRCKHCVSSASDYQCYQHKPKN